VVACRGASKEGAIPVSHLGYRRFGVEGLRFTNSRDRESRKVLALRPGLWSHGDVRLTPGVKCAGWVFMKDLWIGFVEGSNREPKEPLRLEENLERSCVDLGPEGRGSASEWYQSLEKFLFFL
jgi:hypothetical protein